MKMPDSPCALVLRAYGVCFATRVVHACVDLSLPASGVDVLMGPVRSGKSTLLRAVAGLLKGNALCQQWGQVEAPGGVALVQQHAAILKASVGEAVVHAVRQQGGHAAVGWREYAAQALAEHGLQALQTKADVPMLDLPLEQQRAVGILSQALARPGLLMVDEPTYGLDEAQAGWLIDWLRRLGQQQRLLVVLHHQGQARRLADRIVLIGGGRVLAHEPTEVFFTRPPNPWVAQFVRSGSLAIASPDAAPEDLSPEVEPPPPLPPEALQAVALFRASQAKAAPPPRSSPAPIPVPAAHPPTAAAPAQEVSTVTRKVAALPPLSRNGVEDASTVGRVLLSESRAPRGFCWIVPGKLAGCPQPGISSGIDYDLGLLVNVGITRLVSLTEKDLPQEPLERHGLRNLHLPVYDREAPSIRQTYMLLRKMQVLMDAGEVLAVHCYAGLGRTGTVLAAWLIREGGLSAASAIERLRRINPAYVQSQDQEDFLVAFEHDLLLRT